MATSTPVTSGGQVILGEALQFLQDLPFANILSAVSAGGTNVLVDISALEGIVSAGLKDFLGGHAPTTAPATTAAITTAASGGTPSTTPVLTGT
jgi:hypothetical protein